MKVFLPVDIETTSLDFNRGRILGVGYGNTYTTTDVASTPYPFNFPCTAHNGRFETKWLRKAHTPFNWQFDTLLATSILIDRPQDLDLASVAEYYLGTESWKSDTDKLFKKKNWVQLLEASPELQKALADRNVFDLEATSKLTNVLQQRLEAEKMEEFFYEKLMPAARMLADVEYRGMRIDIEGTKRKLIEIDNLISEHLIKLNRWAHPVELNWNSPIQVKELLNRKGYNLWIYDFKKRTMVESTGVEALEKLLPNANIQLLLDYKKASKLKGFLGGWLEDHFEGRLYPSYNLANTRTGRLSCSAPNLQQVPRDKSIRSLFIPSEGMKYVIGDFAQIEVRVAAHYTDDTALLKVFEDKLDFYGSIANNVLGVQCHPNEVKIRFSHERRVAKEIGLSVLYGIGAPKLASLLTRRTGTVFTKEDTKKIIDNYFGAHPSLLDFRRYVEQKVLNGEILRTKYGRQFKINPKKVFSTAVNTVVQSTASDACLFSQLEVDKRLGALGIYAPLVAIIHDEIIRECEPQDAQKVGEIMEEVMCNQGFICPLKLDWVIANNWGDKT